MDEPKTAPPEHALSAEILADARKRAEHTISQAEIEAGKARDAALAECKAAGEAVRLDAEKRVEFETRVFEAGMLLEERMRRLRAQGELLQEAFDAALDRLRKRSGIDYAAVVGRLAVEAVLVMPGDVFVLRLAAADLDSMKNGLADSVAEAVRAKSGRAVRVQVAEKGESFYGGVLVESADGKRRIDNSFEGGLRRMSGELRFEAADIIFGKIADVAAPAKDNAK